MVKTISQRLLPVSALLLGTVFGASVSCAQDTPAPQSSSAQQKDQKDQTAQPPAETTDEGGPQSDSGSIIIRKKKDEPPPPPAPAEPKVKNPNNETYSLRVDVPIVNIDVSVVLDKNHKFVPGLKPANFVVLEDGVEQEQPKVRMAQAPITAVMLLEFAANNWGFVRDMQATTVGFYNSLRKDDYIAVITYDIRTHILTDFTSDKQRVAQSIQSLTFPTFTDTNMFDALYETLDRTSRIEGRKYILLVGTGRDTFSKLTLDKMLAKIRATPNVTIISIATGGFQAELGYGPGMRGSIGGFGGGGLGGGGRMADLQAQNELKTFAEMTGGLYFRPVFQTEIPEIFDAINDSIRNQYILTYRPTNTKSDGTYRKVQVLLVDNEGKPLRMEDEKGRPLKYSVVARDGYRARLPVE